ncbi:DUF2341 domain-containing protein [Palaeococcus sp. (in: euryarchaeotes)]
MRRGFLLNSFVLVLLIPMLLLLATYEDVSSQIIQAQSERVHVERTFRGISYLEMDFQKALEISGKRAIVAAVDYVAVTGSFISSTYKVNNTIKDLILTGTSSSMPGYDFNRVMRGQTIEKWLINMSQELGEQGFEVLPNASVIASSMELTVAPLDSFRVVIRARIPNITIRDLSGRVVYSGSIPRSGDYIYSIVNLENLEDSFFSAMTGGRYQRSIRACSYSFPELIDKPIKVLEGEGKSSESHVPGELIRNLESDKIYFGDTYIGAGAKAYVLTNGSVNQTTAPIIVNTTLNGTRISPDKVFNQGDMGVLVFGNVSGSGSGSWCSVLGDRINVTIQNSGGDDLTNFQVPIYIDSSHITNPTTLNTFFTTADSDGDNVPVLEIYDENCNSINFWVENWDTSNKEALIWVNVTIPASSQITLGIYFDSSGTETLGDPDEVFDLYDDFEDGTLDGWNFEGDRGWTITTISYEGSYSATNEDVGNNEYACMYTTINLASYSVLSFWWKVSSERWYDYLNFYIDNVWYDGISGNVNWNEKEYLIMSTGQHTIKWCYEKDWSVSRGDDAGYVDYIILRKYANPMPSIIQYSSIETKPSPSQGNTTTARAYDIQPFINCIMDSRYFGVEDGWSFFERLEGSNTNHNAYVALAHQMQDELGVKFGNQYYPIGLVSFMIPHANYDEKLFNLFNTLGISVEEGQSSVDYYFLDYYFKGGSKVSGSRIWGISYGTMSSGDLSTIPFFIDNQTATAIFGSQGAQDLMTG